MLAQEVQIENILYLTRQNEIRGTKNLSNVSIFPNIFTFSCHLKVKSFNLVNIHNIESVVQSIYY